MGSYALQGFSKIKPKINNSLGVISPIGELSTYSTTFTKDLAEHENAQWPDITFVSFSSTDSDAGKQMVPTNFADITIEVSQYLYAYCISFQGIISRLDIANYLNTTFTGRIANIAVGDLITGAGMTICEWVSFSVVGAQTNTVRTWFADSAFSRQYENYEIIVIPPIENLDDFFKPVDAVKVALAERTPTRTMELIDLAKNKHPETLIRGDEFTYTPSSNPEYRPRVSFMTIHYGVAGDSNDLTKNAIKDYLVNNSNYTAQQWSTIFPDIFKTTEFIVLPRWDLVAIPNKTNQTGLNSPMVNPTELSNLLYAFYPNIERAHIDQYVRITTHTYMSVSSAIFGGTDNRDDKFTITDYYPDYVCVGTNSPDFNRMSRKTQEWALMINQLLMIAENPDKYSTLPNRIKKLKRGNITYITQVMDNILYMVAVKATYNL